MDTGTCLCGTYRYRNLFVEGMLTVTVNNIDQLIPEIEKKDDTLVKIDIKEITEEENVSENLSKKLSKADISAFF